MSAACAGSCIHQPVRVQRYDGLFGEPASDFCDANADCRQTCAATSRMVPPTFESIVASRLVGPITRSSLGAGLVLRAIIAKAAHCRVR